MRMIGIVLAAAMAAPAAAEWTLQETHDPFDDQRVLTASTTADELQLEVVCKDPAGKQVFRSYILTTEELAIDPDPGYHDQITTKVRFDSGKARFVSFFPTDDRRGMWDGQWLGARLARSWINASKMTLLLTGMDGAERVVQVSLPPDASAVNEVMEACDQKVNGKSYL